MKTELSPELQKVLDSTLPDQPRSRLEPYRGLILSWRRQGRTYRRIQSLLSEKCGVHASTTMLFKFVKSRSRPRMPVEPEPELQKVTRIPATNESSQTVEPLGQCLGERPKK